ncbi:MAG: DUF1588 domain-containing protein, partial [Bdellovibrionales bacterium]|nr:DUF1588 domain-containing protein [Bdellovibrionales bacterium]
DHVLSRSDRLSDSFREYTYDWLKLDRTEPFAVNARLNVLGGGIQFNQALRSAMISEVEDLGAFVATSGGTFEDLFISNVSVTRNTQLMQVYGLNQAAPSNITEANAVRFPAEQRAGILTRAALLSSGSEAANPVLRGVHLGQDVLCVDFGSAPTNATEVFEATPAPYYVTNRERFHIKTTSNATCAGCHQRINPLGFAFSNYNSFGRYQETEPIFAENGDFIESFTTVDAEVDLSEILGRGTTANNAVELSQIVARQTSSRACFARKYSQYALGRPVDNDRDACKLEKAYDNLGNDRTLIDMIRTTALEPEFKMKRRLN